MANSLECLNEQKLKKNPADYHSYRKVRKEEVILAQLHIGHTHHM